MVRGTREDNIRKIIAMEDRILVCERCLELKRCNHRPNLGKGDLEPEAVLVLESPSSFTDNLDNIIKIRQLISKILGIDKIYHTFLVRCQPKACPRIMNISCYGDCKLIDKNNICILNNQLCDGIPFKPTDTQIISCMTNAVEEIDILEPRYVFLFGERVGDFMLKSWGIFTGIKIPDIQYHDNTTVVLVNYEEKFDRHHCEDLKSLISS